MIQRFTQILPFLSRFMTNIPMGNKIITAVFLSTARDCRYVVRTEINGFDETGTIGSNLRFVRVGMDESAHLRPFIYNMLHFGSVTVTKANLSGYPDETKKSYVRMAISDPSIDINEYVFTANHQLDVLRQFTLLEGKALFRLRGLVVDALTSGNVGESLSNVSTYLRRYERSPFWMESFVKSYGFRMVLSDLHRTSRAMKESRREDCRVVSQIDGGFPFVFWWYSFLSNPCGTDLGFSLEKTPIYGVTKGDEYYPVVSMLVTLHS